MIARKGVEQETLALKRDKETRVAIEKTKAEARATLSRGKAKKKTEQEAEKSPPKSQGALATTQTEVEPDRQARAKVKRTKAKAKRTTAKTKRTARGKAKKEKLPPIGPEKVGAEQRVSFVVRLTVDEQGQPRRTEIEHAQSGKKEVFLALDVQRLVSFMQACISPISPKPAIPAAPPPARARAPTSEIITSAVSLIVSDVQVFPLETPGTMALTLNSDEGFTIQTRFWLHGPDAPSLAAQALSFKVKVYIKEITGGMSSLLATYTANLAKDVVAYTAQTQPLSLPGGLYRLTTLVILDTPIKLAGFLEGPIVHVAGIQSPVAPAAEPDIPLSP